MPTFTFNGPGGRKITLNGPPGSTYEQAEGILREQLAGEAAERKSAGEADMARMADPTTGMPWYEKALVGAGAATARAGEGVLGLLDKAGLIDNEKRAELEQMKSDRELYQKYHPGGWATAGEVGADIAMSALPVAKGGKLLTKTLGGLGRAAPLVGDIAANMGYAALTAPENRGEAALWGGGGAAAGRAIPAVAGRVFRPTTPGPEAQRLIEAGVQPTFGQVLAEKGGAIPRAFARAEESATSVPIFGAPLRRARERAMGQFQQATREAALPPGAEKAAAGSIDQLSEAFGNAYDDVVRGAKFQPGANPFNFNADDLTEALYGAAQGRALTNTHVEKARSAVQTIFEAAETTRTPAAAHKVERQLKNLAFKYKGSPDPEMREYGELLHDVASAWKESWRRALPPDKASLLAYIDAQFSKFVPVRRAGATGNLVEPEAYTPKVLLRSVRAGDKTPNKSNFLRGDLPQQELATAADKVLGNKVPDSGTSERLLTGAGVGGAGMLIAGLPGTIKSGAALALYGTPWVQRYLTGQTGVQKWMVQNFPKMTPEQQEQTMYLIYNAASQAGRATATQQGQ
jgi:hypothetical protein